jgi:hypothetical protein
MMGMCGGATHCVVAHGMAAQQFILPALRVQQAPFSDVVQHYCCMANGSITCVAVAFPVLIVWLCGG